MSCIPKQLDSSETLHMEMDSHPGTGFSPSMTSCSKELRTAPTPKMPLQITTRTSKTPDFKFELLPLHSQLLRQSLLVSFPPLIDMLKFSGYPYLIRGQPRKIGGLRQYHLTFQAKENLLRRGTWGSTPLNFESEYNKAYSSSNTKQKSLSGF